ncbi:fasciclin domain-containing protein [Allosphingosinicella deserti]|nr:fasciclin domain-containing protein [Sphingomonas deserti]
MRTLTIVSAAALIAGASWVSACAMNDDRMAAATASTAADATVMVGGAEMYPTRNIIENAVNSADHTTLVAAVKAAGLVETLSGAGPFTVFAPTNAAFAKLPAGTVETLLRPENKAMLQSVLIYHVVPGRTSAVDLMAAIRAGGGSAMLTTVQGGTLTARMRGSDVILVDGKGNSATVSQADVMQSNGVIHVTDAVSVPG